MQQQQQQFLMALAQSHNMGAQGVFPSSSNGNPHAIFPPEDQLPLPYPTHPHASHALSRPPNLQFQGVEFQNTSNSHSTHHQKVNTKNMKRNQNQKNRANSYNSGGKKNGKNSPGGDSADSGGKNNKKVESKVPADNVGEIENTGNYSLNFPPQILTTC